MRWQPHPHLLWRSYGRPLRLQLLLHQICHQKSPRFPHLTSFAQGKRPALCCQIISSSPLKVQWKYDKLELAEFVCGYLEFCKEQPESSKAPLFKHWHLVMERAITYSWSSVRNFHLSVNNAVEQGRLSWRSFESIRERAQTFFTHQDLRSSQPNSSRNGSQPARGKAKDFLCKEWNYTGKCSCAISDAPDLKVWTKLGYLESRPRPVFSGADNHSCRFCAALKLCMCTRTNPGNASVALVWKVKVCTKLGSLESRQRPVFSGADNHSCTFRPALKFCMCTRTDPGNANFANRRPKNVGYKNTLAQIASSPN